MNRPDPAADEVGPSGRVAAPLGLVAARQLRELAEQLEHEQIERARARGIGWAAMARLLGVSRQALHQWAAAERRRQATPTEPGATP